VGWFCWQQLEFNANFFQWTKQGEDGALLLSGRVWGGEAQGERSELLLSGAGKRCRTGTTGAATRQAMMTAV
jgi:hypothetical protein